jgi:hypothetical protein
MFTVTVQKTSMIQTIQASFRSCCEPFKGSIEKKVVSKPGVFPVVVGIFNIDDTKKHREIP